MAGQFPPAAIVVVATVRALKLQSGMALADVKAGVAKVAERDGRDEQEVQDAHVAALRSGVANLARHVENMQAYGAPVVVAVNRFAEDTDAELEWLEGWCREQDLACAVADVWGQGGEGARGLARTVARALPAPGDDAPVLTLSLIHI